MSKIHLYELIYCCTSTKLQITKLDFVNNCQLYVKLSSDSNESGYNFLEKNVYTRLLRTDSLDKV